jgi:hypothetical protein
VLPDTSGTGQLDMYSADMATDNCGTPTVTQLPASGTTITTTTVVTLTATDASGNTADCMFDVFLVTMSTDAPLESVRIHAFPNPTEGLLTVALEGISNKPLQLEIYDLNGRKYRQIATRETTIPLNLQDLASGVYFLKVKHANSLIAWEKIVLE